MSLRKCSECSLRKRQRARDERRGAGGWGGAERHPTLPEKKKEESAETRGGDDGDGALVESVKREGREARLSVVPSVCLPVPPVDCGCSLTYAGHKIKDQTGMMVFEPRVQRRGFIEILAVVKSIILQRYIVHVNCQIVLDPALCSQRGC